VIRTLATVAALAASLFVACIHDSYECEQDSDCDVGVAGRCEVDHRCTQYDASCTLTQRRYTEHSGGESQVCYLGQVTPPNACAAGQPPASPTDACGAKVCAALPTCCSAGWGESCVLEAQRSCDVTCDTRIAISAVHGSTTELWDLRYDGTSFAATALTGRTQVDWIAPAPGTSEPRLASFAGSDTLVIETSNDEVNVTVDPTLAYHDVSSVDLDRDQRDTIALEWQNAAANEQVEVMKLDTLTTRSFDTGVAFRGAWGDYDQDGYPDGASGTGAKYSVLVNVEDDAHDRSLDASITSSFNGSAKAGITSLRSLVWRDVDADTVLDLVAFGNSIRFHEGGTLLDDTPYLSIDCEPPEVLPGSDGCDMSLGNWVGTVVPTATGSIVYAGNTEARTFYRIVPDDDGTADIAPLAIPEGAGSAVAQAVLARDLDGDHVLDVVVIDSTLGVWVSLSSVDPTGTVFTYAHPIAPVNPSFSQVYVSVSVAP